MKAYFIYVLVLFAGCTDDNLFKNSNVEVQGHRGARMVLPENSIPAFKYAIDIGVDTLELDLGVTKDNILVVYHDQKISDIICKHKNGELLKKEIWLRELSLEEVKQFDCGSLVNPRFPDQKLIAGTEIPTLDEVLELAAPTKIHFNIEMKSKKKNPDAQPSPKEFAQLLLVAIEKYNLVSRVTAQSFDHRTLIEMKKLNPNIQLAALYEKEPSDWVAATKSVGADIVSPYFLHISKSDVINIHKAGLKVIPWTANKRKEWAYLIKIDVDGIITDDPKPLLNLLGR